MADHDEEEPPSPSSSGDPESYPLTQATAGVFFALASASLFAMSSLLSSRRRARASSGGGVGEGRLPVRDPTWWTSGGAAVSAELMQFAALAHSPLTLVAPLASSSSIVLAALAAHALRQDSLNMFGALGCVLWAAGCLPLILTVPEEPLVRAFSDVWLQTQEPGFVAYVGTVMLALVVLVCFAVPAHGSGSPFACAAISGLLGSISIMAAKVLAIGVRLALAGDTRSVQPVVCLLPLACLACYLLQQNYNVRAGSAQRSGLATPLNFVVFNATALGGYMLMFRVPLVVQEVGTELCSLVTMAAGVLLIYCTRTLDTSNVSGLLRVGPKPTREDQLDSAAAAEKGRNKGPPPRQPLFG